MTDNFKGLVTNVEYSDGVEVRRSVHLHTGENCRLCSILDTAFEHFPNEQPKCAICAQAEAEGLFDA